MYLFNTFAMREDIASKFRERMNSVLKRGDQVQLADELGHQPGYISELLGGKKTLNIHHLDGFARFYNFKPWQLFHSKEDVAIDVLGDEDFAELYFSLSERERDIVKERMRSIRDLSKEAKSLEEDADALASKAHKIDSISSQISSRKNKNPPLK